MSKNKLPDRVTVRRFNMGDPPNGRVVCVIGTEKAFKVYVGIGQKKAAEKRLIDKREARVVCDGVPYSLRAF